MTHNQLKATSILAMLALASCAHQPVVKSSTEQLAELYEQGLWGTSSVYQQTLAAAQINFNKLLIEANKPPGRLGRPMSTAEAIRSVSKKQLEDDEGKRARSEERYRANLPQMMEEYRLANEKEVVRLSAYLPSDVADCRSRGNTVFGQLSIKQSVMNDCLVARRLAAEGR